MYKFIVANVQPNVGYLLFLLCPVVTVFDELFFTFSPHHIHAL